MSTATSSPDYSYKSVKKNPITSRSGGGDGRVLFPNFIRILRRYLIKLGLLAIAMLLLVSAANAQSQIMMEGEYESIYEPGFKVSEHGFIEPEYDAEEGGIVRGWRTTDYFSDWNCSYTCSFEGTIEPGAWHFEDQGYRNYWRASVQRNYEGTRGPPCNYSFSGSGTIILSIYDYDGASTPDRQYMHPIMTPCHVQTYVYLAVVPEGPGDD